MTNSHPIRHVPGFTDEEVVSKIGFCEQMKGGVIMDVVNAEQARIAEEAGACAVMALERVPSDIRRDGGVARASDPGMIREIQQAVSIPVMAKVRIKGEAGTGNVVEAVRHMRALMSQIQELRTLDHRGLDKKAAELRVPVELVQWVAESGRLPVPNFSAGGVATPADAALMMQLGAEAVFVGSGIFKSDEPQKRARAIVRAVTHYEDPKVLVEVSTGLGAPMSGLEVRTMPEAERMASRGI